MLLETKDDLRSREVLKCIDIERIDADIEFRNVPDSSKYKYKKGSWKDYFKNVLIAQSRGKEYEEICSREHCDCDSEDEIVGAHIHKSNEAQTQVWIALVCKSTNNLSDETPFKLKKGSIIVKFSKNSLLTTIEDRNR